MMRYVALLRGINVGGRNLVAMADLKAMTASLGLRHPETLLQSGNLVFDAPAQPTAGLEAQLEAAANARFGIPIDFMVRMAPEWQMAIDANPFPREAADDPARLVLLLLKATASPDRFESLQQAIVGRERVVGAGTHAWAVYPDGQGTSKLTTAVLDRRLGTSVTARNWNTVLKLAARL